MMANLLALAAASALVVTIPGPNVGLIIANSLKLGLRAGLATVLGTTLGILLQLVIVVVGLSALIETAAIAFAWLRWAGVAYLLWLGLKTWRTPVEAIDTETARPAVFWHGTMIAALNPKTLLFIAAFLPQFIPAGATATDLVLVASVFLTVLFIGDSAWAVTASSARRSLSRYSRFSNRISGGFLLAAAAGLALARRAGEGLRTA
jgi:threonine/homoserine/homoserine lactone efflux protein